MNNILRIAVRFFWVGLLLAAALEGLWWSFGYYTENGYMVERITRILWPTSVLKMAIGQNDSPIAIAALLVLAMVANGLLYGFVGFSVGVGHRLLRGTGVSAGSKQ